MALLKPLQLGIRVLSEESDSPPESRMLGGNDRTEGKAAVGEERHLLHCGRESQQWSALLSCLSDKLMEWLAYDRGSKILPRGGDSVWTRSQPLGSRPRKKPCVCARFRFGT